MNTPNTDETANATLENASAEEPTYTYWAYGSNLNVQQMVRRCPSAVPVARLAKRGFKLEFRTYANVRHTGVESDIVEGALYKVSAHDMMALDRYEGVNAAFPDKGSYRRLHFDDASHGRVYYYRMTAGDVAPSDNRPIKPPKQEYFDIITHGADEWNIPMISIDTARDLAMSEHNATTQ